MDPILITFGEFSIRWYSLFILIAVFLVFMITIKEAKRFKIQKDYIFNLLFWGLIFGIIGARLYYVVFNFSVFKDDLFSIFRVWEGGLAIHGGIIGGLLTTIFYTKKYNVKTLRITDIIVVPLLLGQAIGRWGNFFNQEAHGVATTIEHLKSLHIPDFIIKGMTIEGVIYTPTFLYESIICLISFFVMLIIRRRKYLHIGTLTSLYLIIYGTLRFFIEISRTDALMIGAFKIAQIISIIMILIGLGMLMFISRKGKFEDLYNDSTNTQIITF